MSFFIWKRIMKWPYHSVGAHTCITQHRGRNLDRLGCLLVLECNRQKKKKGGGGGNER